MTAVRYTVLALVLLAIFCQPGWTELAVGQGLQDKDIARQIHEFVLHLMVCHLSPALTLTVVKDGRVLLANGYGFTSTNKSRQVTSETKFAIGSLTKAFTSTLVAKWVHHQPTITIDTPIQSFYPAFQVTDDHRSSKATLRDLLSHRMGIPSFFNALQMGFPPDVTRDDLIKRLAFMPSRLSFRSKFVYNNYMYTMAAHVIEKMSGNRKWEELIRDAFLAPLNMDSTGFLPTIRDFSNFALPCAMINGSIVDLPTELFNTVSPCDPAGSIYTNAKDMAKWMTFLLSEGLGPGDRAVVEPEVIRLTFEPGMISSLPFEELSRPRFPVSHVVQSYDMGWLTANYRGYRKIYHTGGVVTHSSRLWLYPDVKAGIFINVNGPQEKDNKQSLLESLMYFVSDLLLGERPWLKQDVVCQLLGSTLPDTPKTPPTHHSAKDSARSSLPDYPKTSSTHHSAKDAKSHHLLQQTTDRSHIQSAHNMSNYVGNYSHKCFGVIEISLDANHQQLVFKYGQFGWMSLKQISELDFRGHFFGPLSYLNPGLEAGDSIRFVLSSRGAIDAILYSMDAAHDLIQFNRVRSGSGREGGEDYYDNGAPGRQSGSLMFRLSSFLSLYLLTCYGL